MGRASRKKKVGPADEPAPVMAKPPEKRTVHASLDTTDWLLLSAVLILSLAVYARTLCPTIFTSGAGENVTAVKTLGVPHPPGFPLFVLLGKLFTYLIPFGTTAFRVNFFAAVCGAAATAMLYVCGRTLLGTAGRFAAAASALLFAFSQTFWSQAVIAEVYTLNAFLLICIFYMLLRWERGSPLWPVALFAGFGLTVHPTQVLFFPGWFYFIFRSPRRNEIDFDQIKKCALAFAAPLSLHLYPLLRSKSNPPLDWGNPENLQNWIAYLTASQYQDRMFTLPFASVLENANYGHKLLVHEFTPWLALLPLAGAVVLFRKNKRLFAVTFISALLTFLYAINYNIPWEIDVYYIPIALVTAFWMLWLFSLVPQKFSYALPFLAAVPLVLNFHHNDRSGNTLALDYGIDLLNTAPENSNLILPQTDAAFAVLYLTAAEKKRADLSVWIHTDDGVSTLRDGVNPDKPGMPMQRFLAEKKDVFLAQRVTAETVSGYEQIPYGALYVLARKENRPGLPPLDFANYRLEKYAVTPPAFYLDDRNRAVLASYHISRGDNAMAAGKQSGAMQEYLKAEKLGTGLAEVHSQLAMRFIDVRNTAAAIAQLRASIRLAESAGDQNRLGRLLAESGRTDEAMSAFIRAIELDPGMAIAHSNLGAILGMKGDVRRALQSLETAVRLDPRDPKVHNNLALAYLKAGQRDAAVAHWKLSLNLDPTQEQVKNQLTELQVQ